MMHLTAAIGDFMMLLITAALWAAAGVFGLGLLGAGALGGLFLAVRHRCRHR